MTLLKRREIKLKNFLDSRKKMSREAFIDQGRGLGFSADIVECTYDIVKSYLSFVSNPNIHLNDSITEDYNLLDEDFEIIGRKILECTNIKYPSETQIKLLQKQRTIPSNNTIINIIEAADFYRKLS